MLPSEYIEDVFIKFYDAWVTDLRQYTDQDLAAATSFYNIIVDDQKLTQNQANFALKLLEKYKLYMFTRGVDYSESLINPRWKNSFRVLDYSKRISVEKDDTGLTWVLAKFPYQLKKEFDSEIDNQRGFHHGSSWDSERKVRRLNIYECNLIQLYEFAKKHNFEIDDTFMIALGEVEEIWQNQDEILPGAFIDNVSVGLVNASTETQQWWANRTPGTFADDLLLAKSMGYVLQTKPTTLVEKIAASPENSFWIKQNKDLFDLYKTITGRICIVLDRTGSMLSWLDRFAKDADIAGVDRDDIKVCFRETRDHDSGVNGWIKQNGLGTNAEGGRILIFEYKPAKWLFKDKENVKIVVSNNLYPATNQTTKDWFDSHPCVVYLGDIKPSEQKGQKIVEL